MSFAFLFFSLYDEQQNRKKGIVMKKYILFNVLFLYNAICYTDPIQDAFTHVYRSNFWANSESASGPGSTLKQTATLRTKLAFLFEQLGVSTVLDAACGDFNWFEKVYFPLKQYFGIDIVPDIIERNKKLYGNKTRTFECKNIIRDQLPRVDLIICRDCFVHLTFNDIKAALRNFKASGSTYVLMTTFKKKRPNTEIARYGFWRTLNMELPPFNLPEPLLYLNEGCTEANADDSFDDKCLGLWELADLDI